LAPPASPDLSGLHHSASVIRRRHAVGGTIFLSADDNERGTASELLSQEWLFHPTAARRAGSAEAAGNRTCLDRASRWRRDHSGGLRRRPVGYVLIGSRAEAPGAGMDLAPFGARSAAGVRLRP